MRPAWLLAPIVAAVLAGCSLVLSGDLDDARVSGDAGLETSTPIVTVEGGTDARDAETPTPDAGPKRGCASVTPTPKFCRDFDDGLSLDATWGTVNRDDGNSVIDKTTFFSAPAAAKVTLAATSGCKYSRLEQAFEGIGPKRVTIALRMRPVQPWTNGLSPLVFSVSDRPTKYCAALLYLRSSGGVIDSSQINVQSQTNMNNVQELKGAALGDTWNDVEMTFAPRAGGGATFTSTFTPDNGVPAKTTLDFPECLPWKAASIEVGFHCGYGTATAYYDDVRVDWD